MVPALEKILAKTKSLVFFGGAGVSTESGIPDFRSVDGLYHQKFRYPPEVMLSHSFYESHTAEFDIGKPAHPVGQRGAQHGAVGHAFAGGHGGRTAQAAGVQACVHAYISLPMAAATLRHRAMVSANLSGFRHCAPSLQAHCGLSCTSISSPSAPAATAASAMLWMYL